MMKTKSTLKKSVWQEQTGGSKYIRFSATIPIKEHDKDGEALSKYQMLYNAWDTFFWMVSDLGHLDKDLENEIIHK